WSDPSAVEPLLQLPDGRARVPELTVDYLHAEVALQVLDGVRADAAVTLRLRHADARLERGDDLRALRVADPLPAGGEARVVVAPREGLRRDDAVSGRAELLLQSPGGRPAPATVLDELPARLRRRRRLRRLRVTDRGGRTAAVLDVVEAGVDVTPRACGGLDVAVPEERGVVAPPSALALGVDGRGGSDLSLRGLVRLIIPRKTDRAHHAVAAIGVRTAPVEAHALVGAPRREDDHVVRDAVAE